MDVATTVSSSGPISVSLSQTVEVLMEIDDSAEEVFSGQENFTLASGYLTRLIPILRELLRKNMSGSAGLSDAINFLNMEVIAAKNLMLEYSQRSKMYLLMNCRNMVKRLEATIRKIGHALGLISLASHKLSTDIVEEIEKLSIGMLAAEFRISIVEEQIMEIIETGIQERSVDRSYANSLSSLIAEAIGIPLERPAIRKMFEEFKCELEIIQLRKDQAQCIQMDQIVALLGRADANSSFEEKHAKYLTKRNSLGNQLVEPLEAFYCPISGDVMVNPVETSSGHTFERTKIEKWFAKGKDLCPLTMIPIDTSILRPNKNLRLAIEEWKDRNTIITIGLLKQKLLEVNQDVLQCLKQLQCICEEKAVHCEWVVYENYLPCLANLLGTKNRDITKGALRVLGILMKVNNDVKEIISTVDNVIPLVVCSLGRQAEERKLAISLLLEMSKSVTLQDSIGKVRGCILLLVTMSRSDDSQEAKKAQELLDHLSISNQFTLQMARANYFKPLLQLLSSGFTQLQNIIYGWECFRCAIKSSIITKEILSSLTGSRHVKMLMTKTLGEMELSVHSKSELVENGVLSLLLPLLSDENVELKKEVINALQNLSTVPQIGLQMIREGVSRPLHQLLKHIGFASQSWCEAAVTTIMNLSIASKFQETDRVLVTLFETDDDIFRLFSLIGVTSPSIQQKVLQALQALCHSPEATNIERVLMQCSALRMLVKLCENNNLKVRSNAMNLLSCLVEDCDESTLLENQMDKKSIETILKAINSFDDDQDVASAMSVIYNFPNGTRIRDWLVEARAVSIICSVIKKRTNNKLLTENAVGALSRFVSPADLDAQKIASNAGVIPVLVTLLETGTSVGNMRAAACLSKFSVNSHALSRRVRQRSALACFSPPTDPACPIHEGICTVETSFCLVEADAVVPLVKILAEANEAAVCEASIDALLTLIDGPRLEEGCKVLAEAEAIPLIIKLLSSPNKNLQEKALVALERIFREAEYNVKFESSAQLALVDIASRGNMNMRSLAAKTLAHMHVLHDQSAYF